jgi:hypothetical protein
MKKASSLRSCWYVGVISLILFSNISLAQNRNELKNSMIYAVGTYKDGKYVYTALQHKQFIKDTIIKNKKFEKIRYSTFTDNKLDLKNDIYFENFDDSIYSLLDGDLQAVHQINYTTNETQIGKISGKPGKIQFEFVDTRSSFPRDSLRPSLKTPRKYYLNNDIESYIVIIPDLRTAAISGDGKIYSTQLMGDNYNQISQSIRNGNSASNKFSIVPGDEIQLFYRRKWHNDTTGIAEYEDKQFKNIKYQTDTLIKGRKTLKFSIDGYNYLSGNEEQVSEFFIQLNDSGYYSGNQFIPFKTYSSELRVANDSLGNYFFLQGITNDTIGSNVFPRVVQAYSNNPYRISILTYFPMPYFEVGNVEGIITYAKINGKESGRKKERTYITDRTNIRQIKSVSSNKVSITLYVVDDSDITITLPTAPKPSYSKHHLTAGLHTIVMTTNKLTNRKYYPIEIEYKSTKESGSFSNGFETRF